MSRLYTIHTKVGQQEVEDFLKEQNISKSITGYWIVDSEHLNQFLKLTEANLDGGMLARPMMLTSNGKTGTVEVNSVSPYVSGCAEERGKYLLSLRHTI